MKFIQSIQQMNDALNVVMHALSARSTMPILECVLVQCEDDHVSYCCSDGALTIVAHTTANVEESGSISLPGRLFCEIVRKLPNEREVLFHTNARNTLSLFCGLSRSTLAGRAGDLFPPVPQVDAVQEIRLPQSLIKEMIAQTQFAISTEETRKILTGELFEVKSGSINLVALDGFRVAIRRAPAMPDVTELSAVIPGRLLSELSKILTDDEDRIVEISLGDRQIRVRTENADAYASLLEGEFIDYRRILPTSFRTKTTLDRAQLDACIDRASLFARESKTNLVKMSMRENLLVITSNSENGDLYEEQEIELEGEPLDISFNVKYLSDMLGAIRDERIELCFNSGIAPCVVLPVEGDAFAHMILPVRLNA